MNIIFFDHVICFDNLYRTVYQYTKTNNKRVNTKQDKKTSHGIGDV